MKLPTNQRPPGPVQEGPSVAPTGAPRERRQGFDDAFELKLGVGVPALQGSARRVHALQSPRVPVRPAQLPRHLGRVRRLRGEFFEELIEPGDPHGILGLQLRQAVSQYGQIRIGGVVIGTHRDRDVARGRPPGELRSDGCPGLAQALAVRGKRGPDFVAVGREMPDEQIPAVRAAPAIHIARLPRLAAESAPERGGLEAELARERREDGRVTKRVRRIEDFEPPAPARGVRRAIQQVPDEGLSGGDELVRQHVPGAELQPATLGQGPEGRFAVGADREVVFHQHRLPVEQKGTVARIPLEQGQQVVEGRHQTRREGRAWEIPLAVPVGMRDQVKR